MRILIVATLAFALVAPIALAVPEDKDTSVAIPLPTPGGGYFVTVDESDSFINGPDVSTATALRAQIWQDTNGVPGLQRTAYEDENGRIVASDEQVF